MYKYHKYVEIPYNDVNECYIKSNDLMIKQRACVQKYKHSMFHIITYRHSFCP